MLIYPTAGLIIQSGAVFLVFFVILFFWLGPALVRREFIASDGLPRNSRFYGLGMVGIALDDDNRRLIVRKFLKKTIFTANDVIIDEISLFADETVDIYADTGIGVFYCTSLKITVKGGGELSIPFNTSAGARRWQGYVKGWKRRAGKARPDWLMDHVMAVLERTKKEMSREALIEGYYASTSPDGRKTIDNVIGLLDKAHAVTKSAVKRRTRSAKIVKLWD